ncbi:MAG: GTPase Era [Caldilineaceae bacterium]|nr:GTPase Era [Caldilineaceae bacterium]
MHDTQPTDGENTRRTEHDREQVIRAEALTTPSDHHSGFVAVIGRPNVGKSTLLNRLLGQKLAITSPKPQTTRDQLLGILTEDHAQIMFLDTPGIHKPKHKLGEYMVAVAEETIRNADLVLWLVDLNSTPTEEEEAITALFQQLYTQRALPPLLVGLNQVDRWSGDAAATESRINDYRQLLDWYQTADGAAHPVTILRFSAKAGAGIEELLTTLRQQLPLGPRYYPDDQVTDMQTRFIVAELIREQALNLLDQEVPHGIAVEVDEFTERTAEMTYISAVIYVERQSQKAIVLGENGRMIKAIGKAARPAIEELVETRVYLELWVKVWEKWRKRGGMLRQLGYAMQK